MRKLQSKSEIAAFITNALATGEVVLISLPSVRRGRQPKREMLPMQQSEAPRKLGYSIDEFSELSSIGRTKLFEFIKQGRLKIRKAGQRTIILPADGEAFIQSLEAT